MKKIMCLILSVAMIINSIVFCDNKTFAKSNDGVNEPLSRLLTLSDYQKWTSDWQDDWASLQLQLNKIVEGAYNAGASPDYMLFGGDYSCLSSASSSNEGQKQVLDILQETWPNLTPDNYVLIQGNHDPADTEGIAPTGAYYFDDFIIYVLNEDDFPTKQGSSDVLPGIRNTADALKEWLEDRVKEHETRPVFIASHTGLHYDIDRQDGNNQYAYVMFDAINEAAKQLDVVFLFGHNHTNGDEQVGGSLTFYPKGDKLDICTETSIANKKGTSSTINFTYMNYGYVGYIGDIYNNPSALNPTDILTISQLSIYNDRIEVERYSEDGLVSEYSETIRRDHCSALATPLKKYEVYYEARGGQVPVVSEEIYEGVYTINRNKPSRKGYSFKGYVDDEGRRYQPGDEIIVDNDVTLKAQWEKSVQSGDNKCVLTDTINPGKRYIMVWNSEISGNSGTKYALTADKDNNIKVTTLDNSFFTDDNSVMTIPAENWNQNYQWDVIWNQGENEARGYLLQNVGTKKYLCNSDTTISLGNDPASSSSAFKSYAWLYREYNGYNQWAMYNDEDRYLRYSVGGGNMKLGTKATSTDVNNSNVYLYVLCTSDNYRWELADNIESNEEYMVVNNNKAGKSNALTISKRVIGEIPVEIRCDENNIKYIDYEAAYNDAAVLHPYLLADNTFWLDTWNEPSDSEVVWLDSSAIKVTSNHADSRYYFRFTYDNGVLSASEGYSGTDKRILVYNNGYTVGTGDNVYLFKRVYKQETVSEPDMDTGVAVEELKAMLAEAEKAAEELDNDALNSAIKSANETIDDEKATENEIYDALSNLRKAIRNAKRIKAEESVTPAPTPAGTMESGNSGTQNPGTQNPVGQGVYNQPNQNVTGTGNSSGKLASANYTGKSFANKGIKYKVIKHTDKVKSVTVTGMTKKLMSVTIPLSVRYKGISFKVTAIQKNAFKGNRTIKKVVIGKNVKSIGSKAFYGCSNLVSVTIKNKKIGKIKRDVFKKISKKARIWR